MDKSDVIQRVKEYAQRVLQNFDVQQILLFGSYAQGTATEWSDIDIAVVVDDPPQDWLEMSKTRFRLCRDIDLSIEPVLLIASRDRSGFLEEIRRTGELIYSRGN